MNRLRAPLDPYLATPFVDEAEARDLLALVEAYDASLMPFSPLEYPRSSRRRLVDDLRPRLLHALEPSRSRP